MLEGELTAISRALAFQKEAGIDGIPVSIEKYLAVAKAELRVSYKLKNKEAGQTFPHGGKHIILVNGNHSPERQRFTVLHELAHIKLELPSSHDSSLSVDALLRYHSRPREEILCDVFASECLLPRQFFVPDVQKRPCTMESVQDLSELYWASISSTGSRFAACNDSPCAWILAEEQRIRYVSCSLALREAGFWVQIGGGVPRKSVLARLTLGGCGTGTTGSDVVPSYVWTNRDCEGIEEFMEDAMAISSLSQGVALLVAEYVDHRDAITPRSAEEDELLPELDGVLTFPKRTRRK